MSRYKAHGLHSYWFWEYHQEGTDLKKQSFIYGTSGYGKAHGETFIVYSCHQPNPCETSMSYCQGEHIFKSLHPNDAYSQQVSN